MQLPFDLVVLKQNGQSKAFSPTEFVQLPLSQRIGSILGGAVTFFHGDRPVDKAEALRALRLLVSGDANPVR
jgi:hypothetical protein